MVWIAAKQGDTAWPYTTWRSYGPFEVVAGHNYLVTVGSNGIPSVNWKEWGARLNSDANLASVFYLNQASSDQILGITVVPALGQVADVIITGTLRKTAPDVHQVYLEGGKTYAIAMMSGEFDTYMTIEDEFGSLLAQNDDDDIVLTNRALNTHIAFQPPETGMYRLIASAFGAGEGNYTITVREIPVMMRVEDILTAGDEVRNDCYSKTYDVALTAGRRYYLDLESSQFSTYAKLLNPDGMIVAFDDGGVGFNTRIVYQATVSGTHRIVATSASNRATGAFAMTLREEE